MNKHLILYPSVVVTRGIKRSVVMDLEREKYYYVPNSMADIIEHSKVVTYNDLIQLVDDKAVFDSYIHFLFEKELAFFGENPEYFPSLKDDFSSPTIIDNCVLDFIEWGRYDFFHVLELLDAVRCQHLQIRFYATIALQDLKNILDRVQLGEFTSVELLYKYNGENIDDLQRLLDNYTKIKILFVHGYIETKTVKIDEKLQHSSNMGAFFVLEETIEHSDQCGIISPLYFAINRSMYMESLGFNTCLNKKIGIDQDGFLKNCPSMKRDFGHINNLRNLDFVLSDVDFLKMWNIRKDEISDCNVCEHRNMCTDCRAFKEIGDIYSKPSKCQYDPYHATWKERTL